ncbi:MAG: dihydroorotase family protein [Microbacterium sp.]|uniref:dihydroorotase n=1 Tax=Microbacterium sp. TaxID=51671 RepID=UPI0039E3302E
MTRTIILGGTVVLEGRYADVDIAAEDGIITEITAHGRSGRGDVIVDARGKIVIPGIIDTHVHWREPGYEDKEDIVTGSTAAAAGGITTVVDMPNTDPVPNTVERVLQKQELFERRSIVDFNNWVSPTRLEEVQQIAATGVAGFKIFMKSAHYPYDTEASVVDPAMLLESFREVAKTGLPLLIHPHFQPLFQAKMQGIKERGAGTIYDYEEAVYSDEDVTETVGIAQVALYGRATGADLRILHIRNAPQLRLVRALKAGGYRITAEANPWAIFELRKDLVPQQNVDDNLEALSDGTIDLIASDHAPQTWEEVEAAKNNAYESVTIGYPLNEHYLSMYLTEVDAGRLDLLRLVKLTSENPARHLGVYGRKGVLRVGAELDAAIVDLDREATLGVDYPVYSKMGHTPYEGKRIKGRPVATVLRGELIMHEGEVLGAPGFGRIVSRG